MTSRLYVCGFELKTGVPQVGQKYRLVRSVKPPHHASACSAAGSAPLSFMMAA